MGERWRDVPGFESAYAVSDEGCFHNKRTDEPLRPIRRGRYLAVSLKAAPKKSVASAHSVVAAAFLGPRPPGLQVAHLNGDPHDNRLSNLAYVTQKENEDHKRLHGTARAILTDEKADVVRAILAAGVSQEAVAFLLDMSVDALSKLAANRTYSGNSPTPNGGCAPTPAPKDNLP